MRHLLRSLSPLIAVLLACPAAPAAAEIVTRSAIFEGPQQTFGLVLTGGGTVFAAGGGVLGGPFVIMQIPAGSGGQTVSFGLNPDTVVAASHPVSWLGPPAEPPEEGEDPPEDPPEPYFPTRIEFDKNTPGPDKEVLDIKDLRIDLLTGGDNIAFDFDRVNIKLQKTAGGFGTLNADVAVDIFRVEFLQTGPATLMDSLTGEFSVPGVVRATLDGVAKAVNKGFTVAELDDEVVEVEVDLPVFVSVTEAGLNEFGQMKHFVTLDTSGSIPIPIEVSGTVETTDNAPFFTFTGTLSLLGNLMLDVSVHLEDTVVPEPSSYILLALGVAALVPLARSRFRRQ